MSNYLCLPTAVNARYILPINSASVFTRSLGLYTPYVFRRKLELKVLKSLAFIRLLKYFPKTMMIYSSKLRGMIHYVNSALSIIHFDYSSEDIKCAFYISRPGKYVIQVMKRNAQVLGYAKVSVKGITKDDNKNECAMLSKLAKKQFINFAVPRIRKYIETSDLSILILQPSEQVVSSCGLSINPIHVAALIELFKNNMITTPLNQSPYIDRIIEGVSSVRDENRRRHYEEAISIITSNIGNVPIPLGFCHCDYKPWNIKILADGRLYIYDWEMAREQWIPLWDYFHFVLQSLILIEKKPTSFLVKQLYKPPLKIRPYMQKFGISDTTYLYLLLLYIIDISVDCYISGRINENREAMNYITTMHDFLRNLLDHLSQ